MDQVRCLVALEDAERGGRRFAPAPPLKASAVAAEMKLTKHHPHFDPSIAEVKHDTWY